jgi:hypothetical protein
MIMSTWAFVVAVLNMGCLLQQGLVHCKPVCYTVIRVYERNIVYLQGQ